MSKIYLNHTLGLQDARVMSPEQKIEAQLAELAAKRLQLEAELRALTNPGSLLADDSGNGFYKSRVSVTEVFGNTHSYDKALNTLVWLRYQKGTVPASNGKQIVLELNSENRITAREMAGKKYKVGRLSPCFINAEWARKAVAAVGEANIIKMMTVLHHCSLDADPLTPTP